MFVHIKLANHTQQIVERFENALRIHPEIRECYALVGNADYYLKVDVLDVVDYENLHKNVLCRLPGVASVKVDIPLRRVKTYVPNDR